MVLVISFLIKFAHHLEIPRTKRINELTDEDILKIREYIDSNFKVEGDLKKRLFFNHKKINRSCLLQRVSSQKKNFLLEGNEQDVMQEQEKGKAIAIAGKKLTPLKK